MSIQPGDTIPDTTIQVVDGDIRPAQSAALAFTAARRRR